MKTFRSLVFVILVGLVVLGVFALVEWVPFGAYPGKPFFDLAAQTIPILLVALAVEAQARTFDRQQTTRLMRIAAVVFLAIAETAAVGVSAGLIRPHEGTPEADLLIVVTAVGLLGGFFAVIAVALRSSSPSQTETPIQTVASPVSAPPASPVSHSSTIGRPATLPVLVGALVGAALLALVPHTARDPR